MIHAEKREGNRVTLCLYEGVGPEVEEEKKFYPLLEDGQIDRELLNRRLKRAGRILLISSFTTEPREAYDLYMSRNLVEDHFAAFKNLILADNLYLWETTAVFDHVFIGFFCFYLYCRILNRIRQAGMTAHPSSQGLLLKLSKVYGVESREERQIIVVLKQVRKIGDIWTRYIPKRWEIRV